MPAAAPEACDAAKLAGEGRAAGGPGCEGAMLLAAPSPARPSWLARACLRVDSEWGVGQRGLAAERTLSQCRCRSKKPRRKGAVYVWPFDEALNVNLRLVPSGALRDAHITLQGAAPGTGQPRNGAVANAFSRALTAENTRRTLRANSAVSDSTFRESAECGTGQTHARADHAGVPSRIGSAALREAAPCAAMP